MSHFNIFTAWNPAWVSTMNSHTYFWGGVDIFFCISGYVITLGILRTLKEKKGHYSSKEISLFWIKRFYRLIPASWFFLSLSIILSCLYNSSGIFGKTINNINDAASQLFYLSNLRFHFCANGWGECGKNPIYWSLSLEEQFYIIMPLMFIFCRRYIVHILVAAIAVQFFINRPMFSLGWVLRTDAIAWGSLIALATRTKFYTMIKPNSLRNPLYRCILIIILLISLTIITKGDIFPFYIGAMAIPCALLVWIASYDNGLLSQRIANYKLIKWIASRSYSIYLSHMLSFYFVIETLQRIEGPLTGKDTFKLFFFGFLLTIIMSEISYRFIEQPFRRKNIVI